MAITATTFAEPEAGSVHLPAGGVVVKPAVGAGSRDVAAHAPGQDHRVRAHVQRLHQQGGSALVQPLLASVAAEGERALVFFDGRCSHAANRRVVLPRDAAVGDRVTAHDATADQPAVAQGAVDAVTAPFGVPTHARVNLVRDDQGRSCVLALEAAEPDLHLPSAGPQALDRLVEALRPWTTRATRAPGPTRADGPHQSP